MVCEEAATLISARLDGELTPEENKILEEHLACCPVCQKLAEELLALHLSFGALEELPAPQGLAREIMDRIGPREQEKKILSLFRRPQVRALAGLAACAVVCAGLYAASRARDGSWSTATGSLRSAAALPASAPESAFETACLEGESEFPAEVNFFPEEAAAPASGSAPYTDTAADASGNSAKDADVLPRSETVQQSDSVLTLSALPQGWEDILDPDTPVSPGPEGGRSTRYTVTREQWHALAVLAREQGLLLSRVEGDGGDWAVDVTE